MQDTSHLSKFHLHWCIKTSWHLSQCDMKLDLENISQFINHQLLEIFCQLLREQLTDRYNKKLTINSGNNQKRKPLKSNENQVRKHKPKTGNIDQNDYATLIRDQLTPTKIRLLQNISNAENFWKKLLVVFGKNGVNKC